MFKLLIQKCCYHVWIFVSYVSYDLNRFYIYTNPFNTNVILRYPSIISWLACCSFIMHYIHVLSHFYEMCHFIPGKLFLLFKHLPLIQQRRRLCLPMNNELKMTISSSKYNTVSVLVFMIYKVWDCQVSCSAFYCKISLFYLILLFCLCILRIVIVIMLSIYILENEYLTERKQYYYLGK